MDDWWKQHLAGRHAGRGGNAPPNSQNQTPGVGQPNPGMIRTQGYSNAATSAQPADPQGGGHNTCRDSSDMGYLNDSPIHAPLGHFDYPEHEAQNSFEDVEGGKGYVSPGPGYGPGDDTDEDSVDEDTQCTFRNYNEYLARKDETRDQERQNLEPIDYTGFPLTSKDQRRCVKELSTAIMNTLGVIDKPCKNGQAAQSVRKIASGHYKPHVVDKASWEVFGSTIKAQLGIRMVDSHHGTRQESYESFRDRFEAIVEACKVSKALCKQILDPSYIDRLVECPASELQMKRNNKKINAERDVQNAIGRNVLKKGRNTKAASDIKGEEEEEEDADAERTSRLLAAPTKKDTAKPKIQKRSQYTRSETKAQAKTSNKRKNPSGPEDDHHNNTDFNPAGPPLSRRRRHIRPSVHEPHDTDQTNSYQTARAVGITRDSGVSPVQRTTVSSITGSSTNDLEARYREIICDILGVDRIWASNLTLCQLRIYARAYNNRFARFAWHHPRFETYTGNRFHLVDIRFDIMDNRSFVAHFSQVLEEFAPIARARGDLLDSNAWNEQSPNNNGFSTNGDLEMDRALGAVRNPFGFHF